MIQDYINRITPQHRNKPKFIAWLTAALNMIQDAQNLLAQISDAYDIDVAVGNQLDAVGQWLGTSRNLPYQPGVSNTDNPVFAWEETSDGYGGWGVGYWLMSGLSPVLNDDYYRMILKATIIRNRWDGTANSLLSLLQLLFKNSGLIFLVQDGQNMAFTVIAYGVTDPIVNDFLLHDVMIPRPEGVQRNIIVSSSKIFAWGSESDIYAGWGEGNWVSPNY